MLFTRWASFWLLYDRFTMLLFCAFFNTWKALSFIAFSTMFSLLLFSVHSLMLIELEIPLIKGQPLIIAFFLVLLWFLGEGRNKLLWPALALKQKYRALADTTFELLWLQWLFKNLGISSATPFYCDNQKVSFILFTMISSMNRLNTSRLIVILSIIILSMVLSS